MYARLEETGRIDNFRKAAGHKPGKFEGAFFNDSDVYKVLEGAAYTLAAHPDKPLEARIDAIIDEIAAAQQPDGYINTYYTLAEPDKRWFIAGASRLRMFHWKDGAWHDVTSNVDTVGLKVTGRTDSFSEFAIMAPTSASEVSTPASSPWSIALFAALIALSAAPLRRAGRA
jgi:DUF1680 family protein